MTKEEIDKLLKEKDNLIKQHEELSALSSKDMWLNEKLIHLKKNIVNFLKIKYNLDYMDRLYSNRDQYGNIIGTEDDSNTNTLLTPVGIGSSQITRDDTLFKNETYDGDRLKLDDLFGRPGDTNNAMDDLLSL